MRVLDLFCGAGGAAMGLHQAWPDAEIVGVDTKPQPRYPFTFVQADAMTFPLEGFDFVWASPPCQAHTAMKTMYNAKTHADLIPATRVKLIAANIPYIIENVEGAPLNPESIRLCGTMFDLGCDDAELRRHRIFESSFLLTAPNCRHGSRDVVGVYGGHLRNRRRRTIGIYGEGCRDGRRKSDRGVPDFNIEDGRRAMGIDWMTIAELCQAIPPAYSRYIAEQFTLSRTESPARPPA